ncbi:diacylglycerol/lipid kinase family protein [Aeromicrobium sp. CTD01-1L150]|uniref:diacylglycerol/lipid kinase family protein n=1 Tax=Aeromicrobium sp. CTD01-1L150 TaxID=3341830 RepID=UPI0035C0A268
MAGWVAIANANAGTSSDAEVAAAMTLLHEAHGARLVETKDTDDLRDVLSSVADDSVVVTLGGDGSLHAIVVVLDELGRLGDVVLALVPHGTGNDFARTIGMDRDDSAAAAEQLLDARETSLDLVRDARGRPVVNAVHVGIGAEAAVEASPWKKALGPVGYAVGAIISGVKHQGFSGSVVIDDDPVPSRGRIIQVAVGNGRYIGGGAPLLPEADPGDGLLDVAISWSHPRLRRLVYAWRLRKGRHPQRDDVEYRRATSVAVSGDAVPGSLDGEVCAPSSSHRWTIEPGAFRMLVPWQTAHETAEDVPRSMVGPAQPTSSA